MTTEAPSSAELFTQLEVLLDAQSYPPVQQWHPARNGVIDIRIDAQGSWFHEGVKITRAPLVRLFSTILRKDPDGYCLVTPAERLRIEVVDVPFVAVDVERRGSGGQQSLLFTTNVGDYVLAGPAHPIRVESPATDPRPYLHVRDGLEARISRPVYYRLAELCEATPDERGDTAYWLRSDGGRFRFG